MTADDRCAGLACVTVSLRPVRSGAGKARERAGLRRSIRWRRIASPADSKAAARRRD